MGKGITEAGKQPPPRKGGQPRPKYDSKGNQTGWEVRFRIDGKQSGRTFSVLDGPAGANAFQELVNRLGPKEALRFAELDHKPRVSHGPAVAAWCEQYVDGLTQPKASTKQKYRRYIANDIAPVALGRIRLHQLNDGHIRSWVNDMAKNGAKQKTIENKLRFLSGAFNLALRRGMIAENPARGIKAPRTMKRSPLALEVDEFDALLAEIPQWYKLFVEFLLESGARWGEVTALQPHHVNGFSNKVKIEQAWFHEQGGAGYELGPVKTERSNREIDMPRELLEKVMGQMADGQEWLFVNRAFGPIRANTFFTKTWNPALKRLALPESRRPRIHDLRHTHGSWLLARGIPLLDVSRRLGHNTIDTTANIYGHVSRDSGSAIVAALNQSRGREAAG